MRSSVLFGCVSPKKKRMDTELFKNMNGEWVDDLRVKFIPENTESISKRYNEILGYATADKKIEYVALMHDDIVIDYDIRDQIISNMDHCDILGVAGTSAAEIKSPALWHLMGGRSMHGAVAHVVGNSQRHMTAFGPYPSRAIMMDGVFLVLNRKVFTQYRFDESNPAKFHFYDLDFTLSCHKAGCILRVGDIMITHHSPGLREYTDEWKMGEKWFLDKHA